MLNVKSELLTALQNNTNLISLLGGNKIYQVIGPDATEFPRITFFEMTNIDRTYSDDAVWSSEIHIQIDIWNQGANTSAIALEVDKTMKGLNYQRTSSTDLYEFEERVFHKAMRYVTIREES